MYFKIQCKSSFMWLLFLFFDHSRKVLGASEDKFDIDFISWVVSSAPVQNISASSREPQSPVWESFSKPERAFQFTHTKRP